MSISTHDIDQESLSFLLELLNTPSPSGFEAAAGDAFDAFASTFADVERDSVGNRYATVNSGAKTRIAVSGHLDEIGFIVTDIDKHGLLRFAEIGGWDSAVAVGQRVRVFAADGEHVGVVGRPATHQLTPEDEADLQIKKLWIDVGVNSEEEARRIFRPGDFAVIDSQPHVFPNRRIMSRSLDNRIGVFIALEVARRCIGLDVEVVAVGTVSEETTQIGAWTTAANLTPDAYCVVDVTFTSDIPGDHEEDVLLGKGPVIVFGAASRSAIGGQLVEVARNANIDFQLSAAGRSTGTDADEVIQSGAGVSTGVVCVPTRYLHMPGELLDLHDVEATIGLLAAWIAQF